MSQQVGSRLRFAVANPSIDAIYRSESLHVLNEAVVKEADTQRGDHVFTSLIFPSAEMQICNSMSQCSQSLCCNTNRCKFLKMLALPE